MEAQPLPFTLAGRRPVQGPDCPGGPGYHLQGACCGSRAATYTLTTSRPEGPTTSPRGPSEPQRLGSQKAIETQTLQARRRQGRGLLKILQPLQRLRGGVGVCLFVLQKGGSRIPRGLRGQMMARLPSPRAQQANWPSVIKISLGVATDEHYF